MCQMSFNIIFTPFSYFPEWEYSVRILRCRSPSGSGYPAGGSSRAKRSSGTSRTPTDSTSVRICQRFYFVRFRVVRKWRHAIYEPLLRPIPSVQLYSMKVKYCHHNCLTTCLPLGSWFVNSLKLNMEFWHCWSLPTIEKIFTTFSVIFQVNVNQLQWPPLNWIMVNWIIRLMLSDWLGSDRMGINILKKHWLLESKSRLLASLWNFYHIFFTFSL